MFAADDHPMDVLEQPAVAYRHTLFLPDPYVDCESAISAKGTSFAGTCE
jgi:hypothetical protein